MRVVIVGGTGLVGEASADALLAAGHSVIIVSRGPRIGFTTHTEWMQGDVTDPVAIYDVLARTRPDAVLHLAAYLQFACEQNPREAVRVNVDGSVNVFEACRTLGIGRIVFGGTIASYGERTDLMREQDAPTASIGLYGMSKRLSEMIGIRYAALHGLTFVSLRYSAVFGGVDVKSEGMALVRQRIKETAFGADVVIDSANGDESFQCTHAKDAAAATLAALSHPRPAFHIYNVAGPAENYMSLKRFHDVVKALEPAAGNVAFTGRGRSMGPVDTARLRDDLGFTPRLSVRDGLALDIAAMRNRRTLASGTG